MLGPEASKPAGNLARRRALFALVLVAILLAAIAFFRPPNLMLWIKAFHIIAVIAWMAGLLYLPRLFIYHMDTEIGSSQSETFKVMESRLLRLIMRPAMMLTWLLGLWLAHAVFNFSGGWLWAKIAAVVGLTVVHVHFLQASRAFERDERPKTARYWRMMNEVPTVLMIAIVILVVVKPF